MTSIISRPIVLIQILGGMSGLISMPYLIFSVSKLKKLKNKYLVYINYI